MISPFCVAKNTLWYVPTMKSLKIISVATLSHNCIVDEEKVMFFPQWFFLEIQTYGSYFCCWLSYGTVEPHLINPLTTSFWPHVISWRNPFEDGFCASRKGGTGEGGLVHHSG